LLQFVETDVTESGAQDVLPASKFCIRPYLYTKI